MTLLSRLRARRDLRARIHLGVDACLDDEAIAEIERLQTKLAAVERHGWCWHTDDGETPFDWPIEWAEYQLGAKDSPTIAQFDWAGRLPSTWAVFTWAGDEDDGKWNCVEYESEDAARAALAGEVS